MTKVTVKICSGTSCFVMVNDELIEEATFEKVVTKIREIIKAQEG